MEIWRFIDGFKSRYGRYRVSNKGRVKNGLGKTLIPRKTKKGYYLVSLVRDSHETRKLLHRIVAKAFIPNPDQLPQVNHLDGDKKNNAVSNLQWCTNIGNHSHAHLNGLLPYTKVSLSDVSEIRRAILSKNGRGEKISRIDLAKKYGVSIHVIKDIRAGKSYRNA